MRDEDVDECAEMVAAHPVIGPRYGRSPKRLATAWRAVLGREAIRTGIIEALDGPRRTVCFVGLTVCVHHEYVREIKEASSWLGPSLADCVTSSRSPMLTDRQVREANTRGGLSAIVWEGCLRPGFESSESYREIMAVFIDAHRGYLWKELISSQFESVDRLLWTLSTGGLWWNPAEMQYREGVPADPEAFIAGPHIVGITRDLENSRAPSWVGELFRHREPRFGFSRSEQRLLLAALRLSTDEELSARLDVTLPTIKKRWQSIYLRASAYLSALAREEDTGARALRGKEKKRRLLAYLQDHPEELRPVEKTKR